MQNSQMNTPGETSASSRSGNPSPYLIWMVWIAWLPFCIPGLIALFQSHMAALPLSISLVGLAVFFGLYIASSWLDARYLAASPLPSPTTQHVPLRVWLVLISLMVLGTGLVALDGASWLTLFYYVSGYTGSILAYIGGRVAIVRTVQVIAVLVLLTMSTELFTHDWWATGSALLFVVVIGGIIICVMQVIRISQKLRMAREEIARLAVTTERLRIARDLHDLLGHNLSLITLKSELAGRLIAAKPELAASEIHDIEQVARTTLQEVREAVSSYRQPTLINEFQAARDMLTAAGILYELGGDQALIASLPPSIEATLAWTVREGVTNVIKHSRAKRCTICMQYDKQNISLEVRNDGNAVRDDANKPGNGLRGLTERVTELGGVCEAGPVASDGFRLAVNLPLTARKQLHSPSPTTSTLQHTLS